MTRNYKNYTNQDIIDIVPTVKSLAGLLKGLGLKPVGGNYYTMRRYIQELGLDTSHWTGQLWSNGTKIKDWSEYKSIEKLKLIILEERGIKCEKCKLSIWLDANITLELHHIDGYRTNNDKLNLQLLCPNCHSYTDNWRRRK